MVQDGHIIVECSNCQAQARCEILGELVTPPTDFEDPARTVLAKCPGCGNPVVARQWYQELYMYMDGRTEGEWSTPARLWPDAEEALPGELPEIVRHSLEEARRCLRGRAYTACAAMCGRAIEALCRELNANEKMLAEGLKELLDTGKIDKRLYEWGAELHRRRNIAAHPDPTEITQRDARYLLDFAIALCDYAFVLTAKFDRFQKGE